MSIDSIVYDKKIDTIYKGKSTYKPVKCSKCGRINKYKCFYDGHKGFIMVCRCGWAYDTHLDKVINENEEEKALDVEYKVIDEKEDLVMIE